MIRLNKLVRAPRQRVFDAWTHGDQIVQWWGVNMEGCTTKARVDPRLGGELRVEMDMPQGKMTGVGVFTAFDPPNRLAFSWLWEEEPNFGRDSLVTVELFEAPNPFEDAPATEIVLTHERLATPIERSEHFGGWYQMLRALGFFVRGVDPREAMRPAPVASA